MGHGSERSSPIGGIYGYAMAAQGISVFVYDKRGTGGSDGEYTQNFELLAADAAKALDTARSEEHTSELQSLMRISYAVFCLKKKKTTINHHPHTPYLITSNRPTL